MRLAAWLLGWRLIDVRCMRVARLLQTAEDAQHLQPAACNSRAPVLMRTAIVFLGPASRSSCAATGSHGRVQTAAAAPCFMRSPPHTYPRPPPLMQLRAQVVDLQLGLEDANAKVNTLLSRTASRATRAAPAGDAPHIAAGDGGKPIGEGLCEGCRRAALAISRTGHRPTLLGPARLP